jgi:ribonuclease HII
MDNTFDSLYYPGRKLIAGLDETGVSDIAGPLVAACVILPQTFDDTRIFEVNDSKKVPERYREKYALLIYSACVAFGIGEVTAQEVDYLGKRRAIILAMMRAIGACQTTSRKGVLPDYLLIDGEISLPAKIPQTCIKDGDLKSLSIACASIVAKVTRDGYMLELHKRAPHYGWNKNKGAPCDNQYKGMDSHGIQVGTHRTRFYPFVPGKEKREDDRYWDWRRGVWKTKTLMAELGEEKWIEDSSLKQNFSPSSTSTEESTAPTKK